MHLRAGFLSDTEKIIKKNVRTDGPHIFLSAFFLYSGINVKDQSASQDKSKAGCSEHIEPQPVKAEPPKSAQYYHREGKCHRDGENGSMKRFFNGTEKALRGDRKPPQSVGQAKDPEGRGGKLKKLCVSGINEQRGKRLCKKEHHR